MSHANAALTPRARLRLAQLVVDRGWTYAAAAKMFMVAPRTAKKWADRYRTEGPAGMTDRSSRPRSSPSKTRPDLVRQIVGLRWRHRLGPVQIAGRLGMQASTVHAVLVRCRINRLSHIDRVTGEPLRRYEHAHPGSMTHVDVTKFGNIPDGDGWRYVGKQQGDRNKATTALRTGRTANGHPNIGTTFVHTVIDDHSRVAYAEIRTNEKAATASASCMSARSALELCNLSGPVHVIEVQSWSVGGINMTHHTGGGRHVEMWFPAVVAGVVTAAVVLGVPLLLSQQHQYSGSVAGGNPETLASTAGATGATASDSASESGSEPAGKPAAYRESAPPIGAWAELHDGVLRLAPGVRKLAQRDSPVGLTAPAGSVGLILERDGKTRWVLAIDNGTSGTSTTSDPAGQGAVSFDDWLSAQAALLDDPATGTFKQPSLVELTPHGDLAASEPGVQMLAQRRGIDLGPNFACPTDLTVAAQVEYRGRVFYVLARRIDGVVDYVTTKSTAHTLDAFLREARHRYESELGYR